MKAQVLCGHADFISLFMHYSKVKIKRAHKRARPLPRKSIQLLLQFRGSLMPPFPGHACAPTHNRSERCIRLAFLPRFTPVYEETTAQSPAVVLLCEENRTTPGYSELPPKVSETCRIYCSEPSRNFYEVPPFGCFGAVSQIPEST